MEVCGTNATVLGQRSSNRPILSLVNHVPADRLCTGKYVFVVTCRRAHPGSGYRSQIPPCLEFLINYVFGCPRRHFNRNAAEFLGANVRLRSSGSWRMVQSSGRRHWEHEGAGRPIHTMSRELVLLAGRPCNLPGCAESANP